MSQIGLRSFVIFILLSVCFTFSALAQSSKQKCTVVGFLQDPTFHSLDTNVYSKPSFRSKVLRKIPFAYGLGYEVFVEVTGASKAGLLKVQTAYYGNRQVFFRGPGWIWTPRIAPVIQTADRQPAPLYALPNRASQKLGTIPNFTTLEAAILDFDCFGFKVTYKDLEGWVSKDDLLR